MQDKLLMLWKWNLKFEEMAMNTDKLLLNICQTFGFPKLQLAREMRIALEVIWQETESYVIVPLRSAHFFTSIQQLWMGLDLGIQIQVWHLDLALFVNSMIHKNPSE